ncbi:hypothetical protein B0A52_10300 [Exophiala mesophila]|uniref:C2H2-type domain-containing protein n=1 Tax=Exophiala mesophila TaxID=212818 RepID=A0A438MRY4_EXOME|nr:hypothetical protein B0A52_10300 [Exophiala mesophila]
MFSSIGLFKNTPCPRQDDCSLPKCIFAHLISNSTATPIGGLAKEYDPFSAGDVAEPPPKRRRVESPGAENATLRSVKPRVEPANSQPSLKPTGSGAEGLTPTVRRSENVTASVKEGSAAKPQQRNEPPKSMQRPISPPLKRQTKDEPTSAKPCVQRMVKVEPLTPRKVSKAPAVFKTRVTVLQALHKQVCDQNQKVIAKKDAPKDARLTNQEAITFALDEEELATKLGEDIYRNTMAQKVLRIKKMTSDEWIQRVKEWKTPINVKSHVEAASTPAIPGKGLSLDEEVAILPHLQTSLIGYEKYGYVTQVVPQSEIKAAMAAASSTGGYEVCDRCGTRFQVFPGRDEHGRLTSHGTCRHHWAKLNRAPTSKSTKILGQSEATFPCCGQAPGSEGCTEGETHVFNVKDPKRLSLILPFETTPGAMDEAAKPPLAFDCEMGYTTLGMEVIRVTAVRWPSGQLVLDVLVRPFGEILDLNTRFSGIHQEAFAAAPEYKPGREYDPEKDGLRKVASPAVARQLLFDHLTPSTVLMGHAIDNDLNVCRIIHPMIVDTVMLFPHPRGLPYRQSLKYLAQKVLNRGIQMGGAEGHDSKEDSIATGDLVRKKVAERWSLMYHEGWRFVDGKPTKSQSTQRPDSPATK